MYSTITTSCKPDVTLDWRDQSHLDNTSWEVLHRQHVHAWRQLRTRAESFVTGLSSHEAGAAPW
jgi:hypothetical protein